MKATQFEFRFRLVIAALFYCLGFWAPWLRYGPTASATANSTAWLALSTSLARWNLLPLQPATLLVTSLAIAAALAGAAIRIWGTAYLGASVVQSSAMHAGQVMAGGPYRFVRNPLYLGTGLFSIGISILMPPSGAALFLIANLVFYLRLILGEEDFLRSKVGDAYQEYCHRVPRLIPSLRPRVPAPVVRPHWLEAALAETYALGTSLCLAVLAWRYEPRLLIQCLLVCFGLSLVAQALLPRRQQTA